MILAPGQADLDQWKQSLHSYEKGKRTKRPFGKRQAEIEKSFKSVVQEKEMKFNPVLQSFKDEKELSKTIEHEEISRVKDQLKHMKNNYKYTVDYDIINMYPSYSLPEGDKSQPASHENRKKQYKDPTYIDFDIINGSDYSPSYLQKRWLKHLKQPQRKIINKDNKSYDIIKGSYTDRDTENQSRISEMTGPRNSLQNSMMGTFDPISCKYINPEQERLNTLEEQKLKNASRDFKEKLLPSYRYRESFSLNPREPLPPVVSESLERKNQMTESKYKQRYEIEAEYKMRNQYQSLKSEQMAKNRVHNGRLLQAKSREFNILNSQQYDSKRTEHLYGKEVPTDTYDLRPYAKQSPIKQSGFSCHSERFS